jgi:hypothetical protein
MKVRLDALIAEIARTLDVDLLRRDPNFVSLFRPHRMHYIVASLVRCDIARAEKYGRRVLRWRPSPRLKNRIDVKSHGTQDKLERIERPVAISTLADEFAEFLQANDGMVEEVAFSVLRRFAML